MHCVSVEIAEIFDAQLGFLRAPKEVQGGSAWTWRFVYFALSHPQLAFLTSMCVIACLSTSCLLSLLKLETLNMSDILQF